MDLDALYEQTVRDHASRPRNRRAIEGGHKGEQRILICGDRITVYVDVEHEVLRDVSFEGSACAIVLAAASLMTEAIKGRAAADAEALAERCRQMFTAPGDGSFDDLGPLAALGGIRRFPMRIKCALLPWQALCAAVRSSRSA